MRKDGTLPTATHRGASSLYKQLPCRPGLFWRRFSRWFARSGRSLPRPEQKKLQGTWVNVSFKGSGKPKKGPGGESIEIKFDGGMDHRKFGDQVVGTGPFTLDPSRDPMEMDVQSQEGRFLGKTSLSIYAWDGEKLKVCGANPDGGIRPTDFTTTPGDERVMVAFKRRVP